MTKDQATPEPAGASILPALLTVLLLGSLGAAGWLYAEGEKARAEAAELSMKSEASRQALEMQLSKAREQLALASARAEEAERDLGKAEAGAAALKSEQSKAGAAFRKLYTEVEDARLLINGGMGSVNRQQGQAKITEGRELLKETRESPWWQSAREATRDPNTLQRIQVLNNGPEPQNMTRLVEDFQWHLKVAGVVVSGHRERSKEAREEAAKLRAEGERQQRELRNALREAEDKLSLANDKILRLERDYDLLKRKMAEDKKP